MTLCEDCEQHEATASRIANDSLPIALCSECDPGPGCRPLVRRGMYSNGTAKFDAHCPQCGWEMVGSSGSSGSAQAAANTHRLTAEPTTYTCHAASAPVN